jgi:hypothetical protein
MIPRALFLLELVNFILLDFGRFAGGVGDEDAKKLLLTGSFNGLHGTCRRCRGSALYRVTTCRVGAVICRCESEGIFSPAY